MGKCFKPDAAAAVPSVAAAAATAPAAATAAAPKNPPQYHVAKVIKAAAAVAAAKNDNTTFDVMHGEEPRSGGSDAPNCLRTYLVLGRLFKLHPDFDVAIAGILAGDPSGCVVLIHETRDEEWTRTVWDRLRQVLLPQGRYEGFGRSNRGKCLKAPTMLISRLYTREFSRVDAVVCFSMSSQAAMPFVWKCKLHLWLFRVGAEGVPTREPWTSRWGPVGYTAPPAGLHIVQPIGRTTSPLLEVRKLVPMPALGVINDLDRFGVLGHITFEAPYEDTPPLARNA